MLCGNCGSKDATHIKLRFIKDKSTNAIVGKEEWCNICSGMKCSPDYFTDALGNRVLFPKDGHSFYSYAADTVFTSAKQMSEHLKQHGLAQKGNDRLPLPKKPGGA